MFSKFCFLLLLPCSISYKILLVPIPAHSHVKSLLAIGKKLVENGNEVHMLIDSLTSKKASMQKTYGVNYISYAENIKEFGKVEECINEFFMIPLKGQNYTFEEIKDQYATFGDLVEKHLLVDNDEMMKKMEGVKFDMCVVDYYLRFTSLIPHRLGIPFIIYTDTLNPWMVRTPWYPSVLPHPILMLNPDYKHDISSFFQRLTNTFIYIYFQSTTFVRNCSPETMESYRKFGYFRDIDELASRSQLYLTPDDPVVGENMPRTSNIIQVGGLTTEFLSTSPLSSHYLQFIHPSNKTIIISFGSQVTKYPDKLYAIFIETFRSLPQFKFIWKAKENEKFKTPENVFISDWIPQNNLLSYSSVKAFVTHAGNNGLFETLMHGVPIVAMPIQGDQFRNTKRIVAKEYGVSLDVRSITTQLFRETLLEVTDNPVYKANIQRASEIFKSAPQTPAERAAYWVEHVIRFGSDHLVPAGNELSVWQYLLLDVLVFVCVCVFMFVTGLILCVRKVLRTVFKKATDHSKKKQ